MSDENKSRSTASNAEPTATHSAAPMWIIVLTLLVIFVSGYYFDQHSGWFSAKVYGPYASTEQLEICQPKSGEAAALARGKQVYENVCGICHATDGMGKPGQAPPLAASDLVNAKGFTRLAHVPLLGLTGSISVAGKDWNLSMAAMGAQLPDDDLAAVLTYIRTSWGNKAGAVTGDDIKKIRAALPKGALPMTLPQIRQIPE
jgi:mono/diheme cytochrome c family protein